MRPGSRRGASVEASARFKQTNTGALRAGGRLFFVPEVGDYQADFFEGDLGGKVFL